MAENSSASQSLPDLKQMGIELSIDDFGTGFSSLSYLRRFQVDTLKIDQSFIRNMLTDADDAAITLAVIGLAHTLRLSVIAEGVETAEHCRVLMANSMTRTSRERILQLVGLMKTAQKQEEHGVRMVAKCVFDLSKYGDLLNSERMDNVKQWLASLDGFKTIKEYLDEIIWKTESREAENVVNVMTIHASKGLEFDYVYLPGWEEGVLPSGFNSEIEEERRLAYVALTRARKLAFISHSSMRFANGMSRPAMPSRFLRELKDVQDGNRVAKGQIPVGSEVAHSRFGLGTVIQSGERFCKVSFIEGDKLVESGTLRRV